jgi:hypothetical protein
MVNKKMFLLEGAGSGFKTKFITDPNTGTGSGFEKNS